MSVMTHLTEEPPNQASRSWLAIGIVVTVIVLAIGLFFGYRWLAGSGTPSTDTTSTPYSQEITALHVGRLRNSTVMAFSGLGETTAQTALFWRARAYGHPGDTVGHHPVGGDQLPGKRSL